MTTILLFVITGLFACGADKPKLMMSDKARAEIASAEKAILVLQSHIREAAQPLQNRLTKALDEGRKEAKVAADCNPDTDKGIWVCPEPAKPEAKKEEKK